MAKKPIIADSPWEDCKTWTRVNAADLQALQRGDATDIQQKRALNFLINEVCALPYLARNPKSQSDTDFALGKQSVAHFIVRLMRLNIGQLPEN